MYRETAIFIFHKRCSSPDSSQLDECNEPSYLQKQEYLFVKIIYQNFIIYCIFQCIKWFYAPIDTLKKWSWGAHYEAQFSLKQLESCCDFRHFFFVGNRKERQYYSLTLSTNETVKISCFIKLGSRKSLGSIGSNHFGTDSLGIILTQFRYF